MSKQLYPTHKQGYIGGSEAGFVLVLAMVVLLVLSMLGAWALMTSKSELDVAGGLQRAEKQFNIAEGGTSLEAVKVGFATQTYYQVGDPSVTNQILRPPDADCDPGGDAPRNGLPVVTSVGIQADDPTTWPWQNLIQDNVDDEFDYRYLVTYLNADMPPKGYDATAFSSYTFSIQGMAPGVIEVGGFKIGPKAML
jgi:hypothetical protein